MNLSGTARGNVFLQPFEERLSLIAQFLFQLCRAIAFTAGPRFRSVLMPAISTRMCVLNARQVEIFFPIRSLLGQRRIAETGLHPPRHAALDPGLGHVMKIFVPRDRALAESAVLYGRKERLGLIWFELCLDEITHAKT